MISNTVIIIVIIAACIGMTLYYIKKLKETDDDGQEVESKYSLQYLTDAVAKEFADSQKTNLKEQNLSKLQLEAAQRKKLELRRSLKTAAFGDENAKKYIKSFIRTIITSDRYKVNEETINQVLPFNSKSSLDTRTKVEIILYLYKKKYGRNGFDKLMTEHNLASPVVISQEDMEKGCLEYEITTEDINEVYTKIMRKIGELGYDDKLEVICQRIFADYKGFGPVDMLFEFSIDEIDCGVSGVPKGTFEVKKEYMTEDFEYSFNSVYVVYKGNNYKLSCLTFGRQEELVRVCQNIYKFSTPYALSRKKGYVVGTMKDGSRIAVSRPPAAGGWCFYARKFDSAPSLMPEELLKPRKGDPENFNIIPIIIGKWLMKTCRSVGVTGAMGTGKTTILKSFIRFIPTTKNLRVYEISPELNLQFTYPMRNIMNYAVTESNANVNIVSECASAEMGVIVNQSATVGSEQALFTHHAKTASDLVLSLRDNLTSAGGYQSEKVAEEVVAKCINFNIHMGRLNGYRYIERITEIIPIRDRRYPSDKIGDETEINNVNVPEKSDTVNPKDTVEYYKRVTDRQAFTTRDIVRYDIKQKKYIFCNEISSEMMETMCNYLSVEDEKQFMAEMEQIRNIAG